jgi:hypothetical protein
MAVEELQWTTYSQRKTHVIQSCVYLLFINFEATDFNEIQYENHEIWGLLRHRKF